ncbi:MAG: hypothetical protein P4N59_24070 [Negativicutes bacterium]|nr:hypothetical protein [Negativicutes bacterium]
MDNVTTIEKTPPTEMDAQPVPEPSTESGTAPPPATSEAVDTAHDEAANDETANAETSAPPKLDMAFLALDGQPIQKMGVLVSWEGGQCKARTDDNGFLTASITAPPESKLSIAVERFDGIYKDIGQTVMPATDGCLTAVSPNMVYECKTEKHEGNASNAEKSIPQVESADAGDLKPATEVASNSPTENDGWKASIEPSETHSTSAQSTGDQSVTSQPEKASQAGTPKATQQSAGPQGTSAGKTTKTPPTPSKKAPANGTSHQSTQHTGKIPQHITGKTPTKPSPRSGRDEDGNPFAVLSEKARDWWNSWHLPGFHIWGAEAAAAGGAAGSTPMSKVSYNAKMVQQVKALLEFAREQTTYDYKATGDNTATVLASMAKGTFKHKSKEKDSDKSKGLCYSYVKVALARCKIVDGILEGEAASHAGTALVTKGFTDVTDQIPDARWAAAGDVIVYEWTDKTWASRKKKYKNNTLPNYGHIDIRDYDFYISDFIPPFDLSKYQYGAPHWKQYQNIRIYRKVFAPLPTQRIRAFLHCIREFECQAEHDDSKRYQMLNAPLPNGSKRFSSYKTHPWDGQGGPAKGTTAAGAYQIVQRTWQEVFDKGLIESKGDRFSPVIQDRIAVMKLEDRGALHLVRTGKIQEAVGLLTTEWTSLPGGKENSNRLSADKKPMNMSYLIDFFEKCLDEERKRG